MEVLTAVDAGRVRDLRARGEFFWLDLHEPPDEELARAGGALGLHPLALEDSREFNQRPKLDPEHEDFVVYLVLDALTDALFPVVDNLEDRIDSLEGAVLTAVDQDQIGQIYRLKQEVQAIHRRLLPQRDNFPAQVHAIMELPGLEHGKREYLRDVGDHMVQVSGELQRQIDDLTTLTSTYFNANANRLNRLLTRLTVMGTFFLVWTLVTSFFGQNFGWLVRHINSFTAFALYQGLALLVPTIVVAIYFWRRRSEWL
jgi:magnesium transporter